MKIPKGLLKFVDGRNVDNAKIKRNMSKRQTIVHNTQKTFDD